MKLVKSGIPAAALDALYERLQLDMAEKFKFLAENRGKVLLCILTINLGHHAIKKCHTNSIFVCPLEQEGRYVLGTSIPLVPTVGRGRRHMGGGGIGFANHLTLLQTSRTKKSSSFDFYLTLHTVR